jgi:hypothetical protein
MPEEKEKKFLKIVRNAERQTVFDNHPDIVRMRKCLTEYYHVPEPYAGNILWWAFEAGWNSRLQKIQK